MIQRESRSTCVCSSYLLFFFFSRLIKVTLDQGKNSHWDVSCWAGRRESFVYITQGVCQPQSLRLLHFMKGNHFWSCLKNEAGRLHHWDTNPVCETHGCIRASHPFTFHPSTFYDSKKKKKKETVATWSFQNSMTIFFLEVGWMSGTMCSKIKIDIIYTLSNFYLRGIHKIVLFGKVEIQKRWLSRGMYKWSFY